MGYLIEDAKINFETDKAICVEAPEFDEEVWIPLSQVDDDSEIWRQGEESDLLVSDWWARKKGWE